MADFNPNDPLNPNNARDPNFTGGMVTPNNNPYGPGRPAPSVAPIDLSREEIAARERLVADDLAARGATKAGGEPHQPMPAPWTESPATASADKAAVDKANRDRDTAIAKQAADEKYSSSNL